MNNLLDVIVKSRSGLYQKGVEMTGKIESTLVWTQEKIATPVIVGVILGLLILSSSCGVSHIDPQSLTGPILTEKGDTNIIIETTQYYDDRKATVIFTGDDWCGEEKYHNAFMKTCDAAQKYRVVFSPAILPGGLFKRNYPSLKSCQWKDIQSQINEGFISPVSHSMSHPKSYTEGGTSYEIEISGSKKAIIDNLTLPQQNWFNGSEYLVGWVEPYGRCDSKIMATLAKSNYLVSRSTVLYQSSWGRWDYVHGLYRCGLTIAIRPQNSLSMLNSWFDKAYSEGGIYHCNMHPAKDFDSKRELLLNHLAHIGNRKDIWYAGFGQAYMYHYLEDKVKPAIHIITNTNHEIVIKISVPGTERERYGLSYPITYKVPVPNSWPDAYVYCKNEPNDNYVLMTEKTSSDFFNGIDAYRKNLSENKVYISKCFPQTSNRFYLKIEKANSGLNHP